MRIAVVVLIACGREAVPPAVVPAPVVIPPSPVVGPKSPVVHTGIAGRVVLDGKPVTDFVVLAADNFTLTFWRDPPVPVHSLDGRFRVATAGTHDVVIAGRGFARRVVAGIDVAPDQVVELGDIAVGRGFAVTGHVRDETGAPVADARVTVTQTFPEDGDELAQLVRGNRATSTDADGGFALDGLGALPLTTGSARLRTVTTDRRASLPVDIPNWAGSYELVVHATGTIEVTAKKPAETFVQVISVHAATWLSGVPNGGVERHELLPAGDYDVMLRSWQLRPLARERVTVTAGAIVPVTLSAP